MFVCQGCKKNVDSKPVRRIVETRVKEYADGSRGTEVVREKNLCSPCAVKTN